ncbi:MAG: YbdD/YjiX family protein [Magnetococcales bacterium]|nr:YbdD/YjiX family protein [Magnetococcales bacterium]
MIWRELVALLLQTARLMVGIPDYTAYVEHNQKHHPARPIMSRAEFIHNRQQARYGGHSRQMGRCC